MKCVCLCVWICVCARVCVPLCVCVCASHRTLVKEYGLSFSVPLPVMLLQEASALRGVGRGQSAADLLHRAGYPHKGDARPSTLDTRLQKLALQLDAGVCVCARHCVFV